MTEWVEPSAKPVACLARNYLRHGKLPGGYDVASGAVCSKVVGTESDSKSKVGRNEKVGRKSGEKEKRDNKKAGPGASFVKLVGRDGFEPSTNWLKANCSTN